MKDLQKLRKRPNGVNIIGLAIGEKINPENDTDSVSTVCRVGKIYLFYTISQKFTVNLHKN